MGRSRELSELASAYDGSSLGFRNRIINGDMRIDQRNAGAAVTINAPGTVYTLDRWSSFGQSADGVFTVQQSASGPSGFNNSFLVTVTTADSSVGAGQIYIGARQKIEGFNFADMAWGTASARPVTLSFWVRSSVTGTFGGSLTNESQNRSFPFSYTINSANTWEQKSVTITGDTTGTWVTNNGVGVDLFFSIGTGSTYQGTANVWAGTTYYSATGETRLIGTNGATWQITGVQLEAGSVATPFERRDYGRELMMCQRYYYRTAPGAIDKVISNGYCSSTTVVRGITPFMVSMRTSPSALEQTGAASDYSVFTAAGEVNCSAVPTFGNCSQEQAWTNFTVASGLSSGQGAFAITNSTGAYLAWSAEL